jgi:hypothetical protein
MFRMATAPSSAGFHDAAVIEAIEPSLWLGLFDAFGEPPGLNRAGATVEHIADRLGASGLPEALQVALEWMYSLGTENGCERLSAAAREFNVDLRSLNGAAPVEFVARVALLAAKDANAKSALERAETGALIAARPASRVFEFRGRVAGPLERVEERLGDLRARLLPWLEGEGLGDRVEVTMRREDAVTRVIVVRGKRMHAPVSFTASGRRPLPHRPIQCDLLIFDDETNLMAIHAPANLVDGYRKLAGEVFWGDPERFDPCPCSLEPLKEGSGVLERHRGTEIRRITLTHASFRPNEGGTCEYSGDDAFELMTRMRVPLREGEFVAARFHFAFHSGGRPMTVEVRPWTVKAPDNARRAIVLAALERLGVCRVPSATSRTSLWDLAVGAHPRAAWTNLLGAGIDTLLAQKALLGTRQASVVHPALPAAGKVLDVTAVDGDPLFYGQSVDEDVPGRRLTHSEVEGLELDLARLASLWGAALGCSGTPRELAVDGLYHVGECTFGSKQQQVLLALRAPGGDLSRHAPTFPTGSVVLAPRSPTRISWPVPSVELESPLPDRAAARRAIVRELRLEPEVDARDRARPQDTLVVDVPRHAMWLHGIPIHLSESLFLFVALVAAATQRGGIASQDELTTKLSRKGAAENTARVAKGKAEKALKSQLLAAGVEPSSTIFRAIKGGYQYVGSAFVVDVNAA